MVVSPSYIAFIFFYYGLAFFSMGIAILLELGHGTDERLRHSLRPLAAFGILHGANEWMEMFDKLGLLFGFPETKIAWEALRLMILAFSFLSGC